MAVQDVVVLRQSESLSSSTCRWEESRDGAFSSLSSTEKERNINIGT